MGMVFSIQQHVGRLNITMNDSVVVRVLQSIANLGDQNSRIARRKFFGLQTCFQRVAVDVFGNQVTDFIIGANRIVNSNDTRMFQLGDTAGLAQKTLNVLFAGKRSSA